IMQEGRPTFPGVVEPAADATGPVIIGHPGQDAPAATPPAASSAAPATQPTPPAAPQPAVAPQEPDGKGKEPPRGDYRFKTLEDADKSYRLLQSEKTRTEQKLRALEAEREGTKAKEQRKAAEVEEDKNFLEFATDRNKQALTEINDLNPDDPEYTDKASACWARANLEIRRWNPAASASAASSDGTPAGERLPPADGESAGAGPAGNSPTPDVILTTKSFVESVLEGANLGIPKDDPLFWAFAEQSPSVNEDGTPIPMKDQIWHAVERTLNYRRSLVNTSAKPAPENIPAPSGTGSPPASPTGPAGAMPMGRSAAFRPAGGGPAATGPVSLADTLDSVMEMRRL
ncbi:MAG: hypothetical protein WCI75_19345, partial [candidate division NC10 bacterium]